ncbi:probable LRR receptor-like serine/threonine-protein kinase At1g53440 [Aristolochia californica]|uniref:probable LRR receptor-like serine/threonine-protein kinase At1g53440 n=1 Tax=Aristolochia californica TaxID=171875 RepID=UPI0035DA519D
MAPEYAMRGYLSSKADVYSFGVVLLEIASGRNNTSYRNDDKFAHLLDWAEALRKEGNLLELVDPSLESRYSAEEATRSLSLALLCTNPSPNPRPAISTVVSMLEGKVTIQVVVEECGSFSQDSQKHSLIMDGPSLDSSASFANREEKSCSILSTSKRTEP